MDIQILREKYRRILESSQDDISSQVSSPPRHKYSFNKTRVMTEYCENVPKAQGKVRHQPDSVIIALKQRIAQGVSTIKEKDSQIAGLEREAVKMEEQVKVMQDQVNAQAVAKREVEAQLMDEKIHSNSLLQEISKLKKVIESMRMDKELLVTQGQFYKSEVASGKADRKSLQKQIKQHQKQAKKIESLKNENSRLRDDIKRMQVIINETCGAKVASDLTDKHFVGKPIKESSSWVSQNLFGETEMFLKREQVGYGNKEFLNNLVKFIERYQKTTKKVNSSKAKMKDSATTVIKAQSKRSASVRKLSDESIKKTQFLPCSALKRSIFINKIGKYNTKRYTESMMLPERETRDESMCERVLQQYRAALKEAVGEKEIKARKILMLSEEMVGSVLGLFGGV